MSELNSDNKPENTAEAKPAEPAGQKPASDTSRGDGSRSDGPRSEGPRSEGRPFRSGRPRGDGPPVRRLHPRFQRFRKKECRFCSRQITELSYKNVERLVRFTTERGKIMPRRLSGNCAKHQRMLTRQIKVARLLALLPFVRE